MKKHVQIARVLATAGVVAAFAVLSAGAGNASAGTLLKSTTCTLSQSAGTCFMPFTTTSSYSCYAKITALYSAPYASNRVSVDMGNWITYPSVFMSAQSASSGWSNAVSVRSPITTCAPVANGNWTVIGQQLGGGSPNRQYTVSLFSGTY